MSPSPGFGPLEKAIDALRVAKRARKQRFSEPQSEAIIATLQKKDPERRVLGRWAIRSSKAASMDRCP
jgi:hypothetical protein